MPRVPSYEPNQVGSVQTTTARLRPADNNGGIGTAVAKGLADASDVLRLVSKEKAEEKDLANDTESRRGALTWQQEAGPIIAQAKVAKGDDVRAAYTDASENLYALRDRVLQQASNPRVRELLAQRIDPYLAQYHVDLEQHQAVELQASAAETYVAQADNATTEAVKARYNPDLARQHLDTGLAAVRDRADLLGQTATLEQKQREYESDVHRATFNEFVAEGDWDAAIAYRAAHQDRMTVDDQTATAASLLNITQKRQASADSQWALAQGVPARDLPTSSGKFTTPVPGGRVTSAFGAARPGGRAHNGVDWAVPEGTAVKPMAAGRVVNVASDAQSGRYVVVDHGDGTTTSYSHLGRQDVKVGDEVGADTVLGAVGMTGHTTGPHVHVVARQHGKPVDPVSLLGRQGRGNSDAPAANWDQRAAHAAIDKTDWSFERKERAHDAIDAELAQRDQVQARAEREADRRASEMVLQLGNGFTSLAQLPEGLRNEMSVGALQSYTNVAQSNVREAAVKPNGDTYLVASRLSQQEPEAFADMNLGELIGRVTPAELRTLSDRQGALIRRGPQEVNFRNDIEGTINAFALPELGISGSDAIKPARIRVHDEMAAYLQQLTGGKRQATPQELRDALNIATRNLTVSKPGMLWGRNSETKRAYELTIADVPKAEQDRARSALRAARQDDSDDAVVSLYLQKLARGTVR